MFLNSLGQRRTNLMEKVNPASFLRQLFMSEAYYTKGQVKAQVESAMNDPRQLLFMHALMQTMFPYHIRNERTGNDVAVFGT